MNLSKEIREYLLLHPGLSTADLAKAIGVKRKAVSNALNCMRQWKMVERVSRGCYKVARPLAGYRELPADEQAQKRKEKYNETRRRRRALTRRETPKPNQTYTVRKREVDKHTVMREHADRTHVQPETVEEWMQRTGQRPEVLGVTNQFKSLRPCDIRPVQPVGGW